MKILFYLALLAGAAYVGVRYLRENPDTGDIRRIQAPVQQLPGPQDPYKR